MDRPLDAHDVRVPRAGPAGRHATWLLTELGAAPVDAAAGPLVEDRPSPGSAVSTAMAGAAGAVRLLAARLGHDACPEGAALLLRGRAPGASSRSARLLPAADGPLALNLPRPVDWEMVPAWLERPTADPVGWAEVAGAVRSAPAGQLAATAGDLGLAVSPCPAPGVVPDDAQIRHRHPDGAPRPWVLTESARAPRRPGPLRVADLSSLWAGPLLGSLLAEAGALVLKVEDPVRPEVSGPHPTAFARRLQRSKRMVHASFSPEGRTHLTGLIAEADVVIESTRPRALDALGLGPAHGLRPGQIWVSITAHGRTGPWSGRAGYGDDAAAAGGLYARGADGRAAGASFIGDAVADPLTGIHGAVATLAAVVGGWSGHIDLALRDTAAMVVAHRLAPSRTPVAVGHP